MFLYTPVASALEPSKNFDLLSGEEKEIFHGVLLSYNGKYLLGLNKNGIGFCAWELNMDKAGQPSKRLLWKKEPFFECKEMCIEEVIGLSPRNKQLFLQKGSDLP